MRGKMGRGGVPLIFPHPNPKRNENKIGVLHPAEIGV